MKKIITYISTLTAALLISTNTAEAKTYKPGFNITYVSGYSSYGKPIYTKKVFTHYDRYGRAVFKYLNVTPPRAKVRSPRVYYSNKHNRYTPKHSARSRYNRNTSSRYNYSTRRY